MGVLADFGHRDRTLMHRRPGEAWCSQVGGLAIERAAVKSETSPALRWHRRCSAL
jgi:hypothetical protein